MLALCLTLFVSFVLAEPTAHEPSSSSKRVIIPPGEIYAVASVVPFEEQQESLFKIVREKNKRREEIEIEFRRLYGTSFESSDVLKRSITQLRSEMKTPQGISKTGAQLVKDEKNATKLMEEYDTLVKFSFDRWGL